MTHKNNGKIIEAVWEHHALDQLGELAWKPRLARTSHPSPVAAQRGALILHDRLRAVIGLVNPVWLPRPYGRPSASPLRPSPAKHYPRTCSPDDQSPAIRASPTPPVRRGHTPTIRLVDLLDPDANTYHAVNQVTIVYGEHERRFDIVLYVNGLPLAVIELKSAADAHATLKDAHAQLRTYVDEFPLAFRYNVLCMISDGITAKYGTPFTPYEHFAPWNVDEEGERVDTNAPDYDGVEALFVALHGLFTQHRFLSLAENFVNFTSAGKRIAKPHQYHAVIKAVAAVVQASRSNGQAGVVWHTQGSGSPRRWCAPARSPPVTPP